MAGERRGVVVGEGGVCFMQNLLWWLAALFPFSRGDSGTESSDGPARIAVSLKMRNLIELATALHACRGLLLHFASICLASMSVPYLMQGRGGEGRGGDKMR